MTAWNETETKLAKEILEFVNQECGGIVAWIKRREDGRYETNADAGYLMIGPLIGDTEEECAKVYFRFYRRRISYTLKTMGWFARHITKRDKFAKMKEKAKRWDAWAKERGITHSFGEE